MKKVRFLFCIIFILFFCSCSCSTSSKEYRERSFELIENDEAMVLELFDMYENHTIGWVSQNKADNILSYNIDGTDYYVGVIIGKENDALTEKYERACEIYDHLMKTYSINNIRYYEDLSSFEVWYDEGYIDADYGIVYYTDGRELNLSEENDDEQYFEEIQDGFYYYVMFIGF